MEDLSQNPAAHLELEFGEPDSIFASYDMMTALLDSSQRVSRDAVREINVPGWSYPADDGQLTSLFEQLTNLRVVYWSTDRPLPPSILRSLEINNPSCQLRYNLDFRNRGPDTVSVLNSTLLHSLKAGINYGREHNFLRSIPHLLHPKDLPKSPLSRPK
jgi:hypothetical protein